MLLSFLLVTVESIRSGCIRAEEEYRRFFIGTESQSKEYKSYRVWNERVGCGDGDDAPIVVGSEIEFGTFKCIYLMANDVLIGFCCVF